MTSNAPGAKLEKVWQTVTLAISLEIKFGRPTVSMKYYEGYSLLSQNLQKQQLYVKLFS